MSSLKTKNHTTLEECNGEPSPNNNKNSILNLLDTHIKRYNDGIRIIKAKLRTNKEY